MPKSFLFEKKVSVLPKNRDEEVPEEYGPPPMARIEMAQNGYEVCSTDGKRYVYDNIDDAIEKIKTDMESNQKKQN